MKKLLAVIAAGCISTLALAQQDPQFSQNMFNQLYVNPAYAGNNEAICLHALYRAQWVSYDGAPKTGVFGVEAPILNNKMGVGLSIASDKIGYESTLQGKLAANYKFNVGNGKLSAGLDFDFMQDKIDGSKFNPAQGGDPSIPTGTVSGTCFDMGAGLYYQAEKWYISASASHLIEPTLDLDNTVQKEYKRNYYGMIGYNFDVTPSIELKPSVFVKSVTGNTTVDINLNCYFNNRFWIGASYRNEDAVVAMVGMNITEKLRLGYSYDFTTSEIKDYSDGSQEVMLSYCFTVKKKVIPSIRNVRFL